ncbi:hypothetical protein [Paracoccus rhizosphaerae]|uniref:Transposase n=1 Tax=Paracoccus rhizosphaerae TaxID=1133347 RepID=A0ABV6CJT3_9RHOB|nr:hypothetical protein [Paracoccus rhizosphaerae]
MSCVDALGNADRRNDYGAPRAGWYRQTLDHEIVAKLCSVAIW